MWRRRPAPPVRSSEQGIFGRPSPVCGDGRSSSSQVAGLRTAQESMMKPSGNFLLGSAALALLATAATAASTACPMSAQDVAANRYVPLPQITPANVQTLQKAWSFHLKPANAPADARLRM